jgi:hypothetical protein
MELSRDEAEMLLGVINERLQPLVSLRDRLLAILYPPELSSANPVPAKTPPAKPKPKKKYVASQRDIAERKRLIEEAARLETERLAKEAAEKAEQERIRVENKKLRAEAAGWAAFSEREAGRHRSENH